MIKYQEDVIVNGRAITGFTVTVYAAGTTTLSSLYSDNGVTTKANPFTAADANGHFEFYAADGRYDYTISGSGLTTRYVYDILLEDPANASALVGTTLTVSGNTVLGDASTDTLNVGNGGIIKDSSGNVGIGVTPTAGVPFNVLANNSNAIATKIKGRAADGIGVALFTDNSDVETARIDVRSDGTFYISPKSGAGGVLVNKVVGLGYGTGAGGTVTQATSKSTAVTLNTPTGRITTFNDALGAGSLASFSVNCSAYAVTDTVSLMISGGIANGQSYRIWPVAAGAGVFSITIENRSAGSLSEAIQIQFNVHKGATA